MHEQKKDSSLFTSIPLNTKNHINSFEMIGWTDPSQPNPNKARTWLRSLSHENFVYPEELFDPKKPPVCIFVPETPILNKMIEACARNMENKHMLYAKFSDMEQPIPKWMLEEKEAKLQQRKETLRILGDLS